MKIAIMNKSAAFLVLFSLLALGSRAQTPGPLPAPGGEAKVVSAAAAKRGSAVNFLTLSARPSLELPLGSGLTLVDPGAAAEFRGSLPLAPWLEAAAGLSYSFLPVRAGTSLSLGTLSFGPLLRLEFTPRLSAHALLAAGGHYGFLNNQLLAPSGLSYPDQGGGGGALFAAAGADFFLSPTLSIGAEASWAEYLGLLHGFRFSIATAFHMDGLARKVDVARMESPALFPSLAKEYAKGRAAKVSLRNRERFPLASVSVGLYIKDLMEGPTWTALPGRLEPGASAELELGALLSDRVLSLVDEGVHPLELRCSFLLNGKKRETTTAASIEVHNRNAITWDDDRKIASFMDPLAPETLAFAKPVAVLARNEGSATLDLRLRIGMALFEAMGAAGIGYVVDPNTPSYADSSKDPTIVDFVQYAKQTLYFRGGDCDDLTTLYCSLLESVGVESAIITVPGHIYAAFALDMGAAEAGRFFTSGGDLLVRGDKVWVPVEVTASGKPFLEAWALGAREWREAEAKGQAAFHEVHEAWKTWEIAGSPPEVFSIAQPAAAAVGSRLTASIGALAARELAPKAAVLQASIKRGDNAAKNWDSLGVLYARYGRLADAETAFRSSLALGERLSPLVNLATLLRLKGDAGASRETLALAEILDAADPRVLLGLALAWYDLQNFAQARSYYARAQKLSPLTAARYAYVGQPPGQQAGGTTGQGTALAAGPATGADTARAGEQTGREVPTWSDED